MQIHLYKLYELYFGVCRPQVILINHETTPKYFLTTAGTANPATIPIFNPPRSLHPKAHGYGPVLWAGAEMISLLKNQYPQMNDSAVQYYQVKQKTTAPIFAIDTEEKKD